MKLKQKEAIQGGAVAQILVTGSNIMKIWLFIAFIYSISLFTYAQPTKTIEFKHSGPPPLLVELFTSEGCHNCPPADKWLSNLADSRELWSEVVPLAFHVDYWNKLGWKDRFSESKYSDRQRHYQKHGNIGSVYTPGFVIAGHEWSGWFRGQNLPENNKNEANQLKLQLTDNKFNLFYDHNQQKTGHANVVLLGMGLKTPVKRGENRGKLLRHDFVVLDWQKLPANQNNWQGELNYPKVKEAHQYAVAAWVEKSLRGVPEQVVGGFISNK